MLLLIYVVISLTILSQHSLLFLPPADTRSNRFFNQEYFIVFIYKDQRCLPRKYGSAIQREIKK